MKIGGGQVRKGRKMGGGIDIEPKIEIRGGEIVCTEAGLREAPQEGG